MAYLKFNKSELVNLSYSLRREILLANKTGAYCNTSIITCNTRKYHGLLAVTLDRFGGDKYLMLSSLDESLTVNGKQFNLGIHCYGDMYEPRGHKYIVDYQADPAPSITYKIGEIKFRKTIVMAPDRDQTLIRFELLESPSPAVLQLRPLLPFRNIHALTHRNDAAVTAASPLAGGVSFRLYPNFPSLQLQIGGAESRFVSYPCWYDGITYTDEYRRGFDCREDLFNPGWFEMSLSPGESVVFSASMRQEDPASLGKDFGKILADMPVISSGKDQLKHWADLFVCTHNSRKKITAGFSWMYTGLLRESLIALPGLVLYGKGDMREFEEILDNIVADEQERLFRRTTQVEAPLYFATALQAYIFYGADPAAVWKKYGVIMRDIVASYLPGERAEVSMQPDGLLWAEQGGSALSWMNAYVDGRPVTERAGYQVETNALWYNAVCFAIEMEKKYGAKGSEFIPRWSTVRDLVKANYQKTFLNERLGCLADYVDAGGQHTEIRPNQLYALWVPYSPVDDSMAPSIFRVVSGELVTTRGIRTLSPRDEAYRGVYDGSQYDRDMAYHQGSTRPFLLEQYVAVGLRVQGPSFLPRIEELTKGFYEDLNKHGVGAFSELYDGDPPQEPHGAIASALSTAALLTIDYLVKRYKEGYRL